MKIKKIKLNKFKRFSDLTITNIPRTARLIILVGPNGCGKTSVFEAFNHWYQLKGYGITGQQDYLDKKFCDNDVTQENDRNWFEDKVQIDFFDEGQFKDEQVKGKFYFRGAYRNESDFTVSSLSKQNDPTSRIKLHNLMQNDVVVSENYQRLISQTLEGVYDSKNDSQTIKELREELIGEIKNSLAAVFEDLNLSSIGDPLSNGSFYFEKGSAKDFHYKNLSAGEKSVFDLLLDMIIKSNYYPDAIFCIDEPEAHMHTRLQAKVLKELYNLTPSNSQIWIATHSIGILKEAEDIEEKNPGTVAFLDLDSHDFDLTEVIEPTQINKAIWDRFFDLAFADFSKLIAPKRIVFCEGTSQGRKYKNFDAKIYGKIFEEEYHDTKFISIGSSIDIEDIENESVNIVSNILKSSDIIKFVDRDDKSAEEIMELLSSGVKTSERRHIESYLFDDEIIQRLCEKNSTTSLFQKCLTAKSDAIKESVERNNPKDDIKSASGKIYTELKIILKLTQCGNNNSAFMRDTLAPLVTKDTKVYKDLKKEIFT